VAGRRRAPGCSPPPDSPSRRGRHHPRPGIYNAVLRSDRFGTGHRLGIQNAPAGGPLQITDHTTGAPRTQQLEPRLDVSHWPGGGQTEAARRTRHGKPWTSHHCHQPQNGEARDRRLPAPRTATHFISSCGRLPSRTGAQLSQRPSYATSRSSHSRRSLSCRRITLHLAFLEERVLTR